MARPPACQSFYRNFLPTSKKELAGAAPTEGSGTPTPTSTVSRAPTPAPAPSLALAIASTPAAANSAAKYLTKDLQQILKIILEARALVPAP